VSVILAGVVENENFLDFIANRGRNALQHPTEGIASVVRHDQNADFFHGASQRIVAARRDYRRSLPYILL
jgi:hypothetical protein